MGKTMDIIIEELAAKEAESLSPVNIDTVQATFLDMRFGEEDDSNIYPTYY